MTGAQAYANWADQLLTPDEVAGMLPGFCAEVGIPATAAGFRADLHERLDAQCRATDGAYPDLADFTIDDAGRPSLEQFRAAPPPAVGAGPGSGGVGRPRHRRRPSRVTCCASVRQPVQLVCQGFGDGTDAAV